MTRYTRQFPADFATSCLMCGRDPLPREGQSDQVSDFSHWTDVKITITGTLPTGEKVSMEVHDAVFADQGNASVFARHFDSDSLTVWRDSVYWLQLRARLSPRPDGAVLTMRQEA